MRDLPITHDVPDYASHIPTHVCCWQELEDLLDDDQDMEDMYLGRRRGEEAMLALQHMAYIASNYSQAPQTHHSAPSPVSHTGGTSASTPDTALQSTAPAQVGALNEAF